MIPNLDPHALRAHALRAHALRAHYRAYPAALALQASGGVLVPTVANHR